MTSRGEQRWIAAGRPEHGTVQPVHDLAAVFVRRGYTVGTYPDDRHKNAPVWEDHTYGSETGWPQAAALGWIYALDLMPRSGLPDWRDVMEQITRDKNNGVPGIEWVKYINTTTRNGAVVHRSWYGTERETSSSDSGHGHISCLTGFERSTTVTDHGYDPVARLTGNATIIVPVVYVAPVTEPGVPALGRVLRLTRPQMRGADARAAQQRFRDRGWNIGVDGWWGPQSTDVTRRYQIDSSHHGWPLQVDGVLGAHTWRSMWLRPKS